MYTHTHFSQVGLHTKDHAWQGRIKGGGGGIGGRNAPPFRGPLNFIKRGKTLRTCVQRHRILVVNSYLDPLFRNPVSAPACMNLKESLQKKKKISLRDVYGV